MSRTINLLNEISEGARRGERFAVVRTLSQDANSTWALTLNDETDDSRDSGVPAQAISIARRLVVSGSVAEVTEILDEQGRPVTLTVEIVQPKLQLLIFGAGHVGQAVAQMGALTGYDVVVVDDREEFASRRRLPDPRIELLVTDYANTGPLPTISYNTAVVIVTRGHQYDEVCLKNIINSEARYIGMIGSRRRVISVFKKLVGEGVSESALQRVHAPIGLKIGAKSPQEIAVAILAEIIDNFNNPQHGKREN